MYINHVSKLKFLYGFREAFFASITERNIQGSFVRAGLILYNLKKMLSKLDVKLYIPISLSSRSSSLQT